MYFVAAQLFGAPLGELMIQAGRSAPAPAIMSKLMEFIATNGETHHGTFAIPKVLLAIYGTSPVPSGAVPWLRPDSLDIMPSFG